MNDTPTGIRPPVLIPRPPVAAPTNRHAQAFAEIKAMEDNYHTAMEEIIELKRSLDSVTNQRDLLDAQMQHERDQKEIFQRKLVRLAASMSGIGALTKEAEEIMRQVEQVEKKEG